MRLVADDRQPSLGSEDAPSGSSPPAPGALTELLAKLVETPQIAGWALPPRPGEVVGRFEIIREVGRGGFGVVYEAHDRQLSRAVAFKAIQSSTEAAAGARAVAEAEAAARLAHPNIVHLYDLGHSDRGAWLIMELLRGRSLAERLADGPLPLREAVRVAVELSQGVAHAHAQGVVHRDLKPSNAFLCEDGQVKILDFGLAQVFGRASSSGGTPIYMAPEQAEGRPGDARSDVYSLGLVLGELLTGEPPVRRAGPFAQDEAAPGAAPAQLRAAPPALSRLVARMTAADPAARPATGAEVHAALLHIQRSMEPRRLLWAGWGLAVAALLMAGGFALWYRPLPPGRLLAALADTDNQSGDPDLDGVSEMLRAGLEASGRLSLMARSQLVNALEASGAEVPGRIGERESRAAAERVRAQLLFLPAVRRAGPGYELTVSAVDLARGATRLALSRVAAAKSSLPQALDELVRRLRESLGEAPEATPRAAGQVADLAPSNPEALRHHAEGSRLASEGRFEEALAAYRRALELDRGFLLPRVGIESMVGTGGIIRLRARFSASQRAWYRENQELLRRNLHRLPAGDAAYLEVLLQADESNPVELKSQLDRVIQTWPEDPRPVLMAGNLLVSNRADAVQARPYLERAIALAPQSQTQALEFLLFLGRHDEALARAKRWVDRSPDALPLYWLAEVHRQRGEPEAALDAARRAAAHPVPEVNARVFQDAGALAEAERAAGGRLLANFRWLASRGRLRDARAHVRLPEDPQWIDRLSFHIARAHLQLASGDPEAVMRELEGMLRVGTSRFHCEAWALAVMGDLDRAEMMAGFGVTDGQHVCTALTKVIVEWKRGDREGALRRLARYQLALSDSYRAEILAEGGGDREAVALLRRYRLHRELNYFERFYDWWNFPRSFYLEAVSLERLGELDEARRALGRLLHLWERADADLPLLAKARALDRRLAAAGAAAPPRPEPSAPPPAPGGPAGSGGRGRPQELLPAERL